MRMSSSFLEATEYLRAVMYEVSASGDADHDI